MVDMAKLIAMPPLLRFPLLNRSGGSGRGDRGGGDHQDGGNDNHDNGGDGHLTSGED